MYHDTTLGILYCKTPPNYNVLTNKRNHGMLLGLYSLMTVLWIKHFVIYIHHPYILINWLKQYQHCRCMHGENCAAL